jgi:4-hydroxy-3-methylbut-2-en-1-yl diphosphate synthase IspG/GcpE
MTGYFSSPFPRRRSVAVNVGGAIVGGEAPVVVQSMTNTDTADIDATVAQVAALHRLYPDATIIDIDLHRLGRLDLTGIYALRDIADRGRKLGVAVRFSEVPPHATQRVEAILGERLNDSRDDFA